MGAGAAFESPGWSQTVLRDKSPEESRKDYGSAHLPHIAPRTPKTCPREVPYKGGPSSSNSFADIFFYFIFRKHALGSSWLRCGLFGVELIHIFTFWSKHCFGAAVSDGCFFKSEGGLWLVVAKILTSKNFWSSKFWLRASIWVPITTSEATAPKPFFLPQVGFDRV